MKQSAGSWEARGKGTVAWVVGEVSHSLDRVVHRDRLANRKVSAGVRPVYGFFEVPEVVDSNWHIVVFHDVSDGRGHTVRRHKTGCAES